MFTEVIQPGQTEVCVDIIIKNDRVEERDEEFCVQLSSENKDIDFGREPCHICVTISDPEEEGQCVLIYIYCVAMYDVIYTSIYGYWYNGAEFP